MTIHVGCSVIWPIQNGMPMPQRDGSLEYQALHASSIEIVPFQWSGNSCAWRASVLRVYSSQARSAAPGHDAVELGQRPGEVAVDVEPDAARVGGGAGERRVRDVVEQQAEHVGQRAPVGSIDGPFSVTSGSLRDGAIAEPIFDGPPGRADAGQEAADVRRRASRPGRRRARRRGSPTAAARRRSRPCPSGGRPASRASTSRGRSSCSSSTSSSSAARARSSAANAVVAAQLGQLGQLRVRVGELAPRRASTRSSGRAASRSPTSRRSCPSM